MIDAQIVAKVWDFVRCCHPCLEHGLLPGAVEQQRNPQSRQLLPLAIRVAVCRCNVGHVALLLALHHLMCAF